jgi:hypothetical protein
VRAPRPVTGKSMRSPVLEQAADLAAVDAAFRVANELANVSTTCISEVSSEHHEAA